LELAYILNFIKDLTRIINEFQQIHSEIPKKVRVNNTTIRSQSAINNNSKHLNRDKKRIQSSIISRFPSPNTRKPKSFLQNEQK